MAASDVYSFGAGGLCGCWRARAGGTTRTCTPTAAAVSLPAHAGVVLYELLVWRLPYPGWQIFRVSHHVLAGGRPELPPREELPGPDTAGWEGLDEYCQLMQCVGAGGWRGCLPTAGAGAQHSCTGRAFASNPPTTASVAPACRSDCWAQRPEDRPTMSDVVARLRALLGEDGASRVASGSLYSSGSIPTVAGV